MQEVETIKNRSQLPCVHFLCTDCLKKLFPLNQVGLTCPVCRRNHANYSLIEHREDVYRYGLKDQTRRMEWRQKEWEKRH